MLTKNHFFFFCGFYPFGGPRFLALLKKRNVVNQVKLTITITDTLPIVERTVQFGGFTIFACVSLPARVALDFFTSTCITI